MEILARKAIFLPAVNRGQYVVRMDVPTAADPSIKYHIETHASFAIGVHWWNAKFRPA